MAKAKLKIAKSDFIAMQTACEINDVTINEGTNYTDIAVLSVSFKSPQNLFDAGRMLDKMSEIANKGKNVEPKS